MLVIHEQKCQELCQAIEQTVEKQVAMMERKKICKERLRKKFKNRLFSKYPGVGGKTRRRRNGIAGKEA